MNNFEYFCPTRILFGKDTIKKLPKQIDKSEKILMIYGGGSIKKNGIYKQVKTALEGYDLLEFSGIEANPTYETCMEAVKFIKENEITFLLAVGGGSVIDATKFIAAATKYTGKEPYNIVSRNVQVIIDEALPFGTVLTLPAAGSEMNSNAVISRKKTNEKLSFSSEKILPQFSIIDPTATFSLPTRQTINGVVDTFAHTMELYCTYDVNTPLQDLWALSLLRTLIQEAPKVLANPNDYEARANISWCSTCGLNYWMAQGCVEDWSTHMIGHELTAFYGIDHAQSLAIVLPRLLKNQQKNKQKKLAKLAKEVFHLEEVSEEELANQAINKIEGFFKFLGMKTTLAECDIDAEEAASRLRTRITERGVAFGEHGNINSEICYDIVSQC